MLVAKRSGRVGPGSNASFASDRIRSRPIMLPNVNFSWVFGELMLIYGYYFRSTQRAPLYIRRY